MLRRNLHFAISFFLIISALSLGPVHADPNALTAESRVTVSWNTIAPDLELGTAELGNATILESGITLVRTSLARFRVGVVTAQRYGKTQSEVRYLAQQSGAVVGINANFFDEVGRPLGLVISEGHLVQKPHLGGQTLSGIFTATRNSLSIASRSDFKQGAILNAVQAGPRLLVDGHVVENLRDVSTLSRRAGVCIDARSRLILYCSSTGLVGNSLAQVLQILGDPNVNCIDALNLDGGGSAQLIVRPAAVLGNSTKDKDSAEVSITGRDGVPVMLGIFARDF